MNKQIKTILLTILTLSVFTIAIVELSGVSKTALINKFSINTSPLHLQTPQDLQAQQELKAHINFQDSVAALPGTKISFDSYKYNFGKVKEGDTVNHVYVFTNTGDAPLIISDAIPTCGCTIPSFSKKPILPGKTGQIEVAFHSANQKGEVHKNIIIVSNAERSKVSISFDAVVH